MYIYFGNLQSMYFIGKVEKHSKVTENKKFFSCSKICNLLYQIFQSLRETLHKYEYFQKFLSSFLKF